MLKNSEALILKAVYFTDHFIRCQQSRQESSTLSRFRETEPLSAVSRSSPRWRKELEGNIVCHYVEWEGLGIVSHDPSHIRHTENGVPGNPRLPLNMPTSTANIIRRATSSG
jgi:hypothetical protein